MKTNCPDGDLTETKIRTLLLSSTDFTQPKIVSYPGLRPASVLLPIFCTEGEWHLLLTRRTDRVNDHKGQVSFPGGASEVNDTSPEITALREAYEEIGINPDDVTILGRLPVLPTVSNYLVTPIIGRIPWPYEFKLSSEEVERIFPVPLSWLSNPAHFEERPYARSDGSIHPVIFFKAYDGEVLWGISALMTIILLKTLKLIH